jgi:hypothetical protein
VLPQPLQSVHSGGKKGGRPKTGPVRGRAAGYKPSRRQLGQSVLRRDPSLANKLAVIAKVDQEGSDPTALESPAQRVEQFSGLACRTVLQWYRRDQEFIEQFFKLKLGRHGLKPCLAQCKKSP